MLSRNVDNIAGGTIGVLVAFWGQHAPDGSFFKSFLILTAPIITLLIRAGGNYLLPHFIFLITDIHQVWAGRKAIRRIDVLLVDPAIGEDSKEKLRALREHAKCSAAVGAFKYWETVSGNKYDNLRQ